MGEEDLGLFIDGWNEDDEEIEQLGEYLESDSESFNAFMEESVVRVKRVPMSIEDTAAKLALHLWSNLSADEKRQQISASLRNDNQNQTYHKLPTHLNLTVF